MLPSYSTVDLVNEEPEDDPWDLPELKDTGVKWSGEAGFHPDTMEEEVVRPVARRPGIHSLCVFFRQTWIQKGR